MANLVNLLPTVGLVDGQIVAVSCRGLAGGCPIH